MCACASYKRRVIEIRKNWNTGARASTHMRFRIRSNLCDELRTWICIQIILWWSWTERLNRWLCQFCNFQFYSFIHETTIAFVKVTNTSHIRRRVMMTMSWWKWIFILWQWNQFVFLTEKQLCSSKYDWIAQRIYDVLKWHRLSEILIIFKSFYKQKPEKFVRNFINFIGSILWWNS